MGFDSFRKSRMNFNETVLKATQEKTKNYGDGYDYWKPEVDKEKGTASAVIRFLPPKDSELPYAKVYSHFFKGDDGKWCVIDRCPTTYGEQCPVCQSNSTLWNGGQEDKARNRKRRTNYVFNIYVVKDSANPDNEGKVFLYKTGPAIFNMITEAMTPEFDGEEPKMPFDLYEGHNFNLRVRSDASRGGLASYDKSFFDDRATAVAKSDEELERIYNAMVNLDEYIQVGRLSENDIRKKIANAYVSSGIAMTASQALVNSEVEEAMKSEPMDSFKAMDKLPWDEEPMKPSESFSDDDEDTLDYFKKLASE